jgi:hypothetical protein
MLLKIVIYTDYDTRVLPETFFWFFFCSPFLGWGGGGGGTFLCFFFVFVGLHTFLYN